LRLRIVGRLIVILFYLKLLLFSLKFTKDVWILNIVRHWVGHRIVSILMVNIEIVSGSIRSVAYNMSSIHGSKFICSWWTVSFIKVLFIFAHLHQFPLSLKSGYLLRCISYFVKLLLLFDSALMIVCISKILLVNLPS